MSKANFEKEVISPKSTIDYLYQGANELFKNNPDMSPDDRAKYFRQMMEPVAKKLEEDQIPRFLLKLYFDKELTLISTQPE